MFQMTSEYSASQIKVLEGLEAVRERGSMYIGDIGIGGLHHLVYEIVTNSIDEHLSGYGNEIYVTIGFDNSIKVEDRARGIPIDIVPEYGISALELVITKLHAGGKFDHQSYALSGGLNGVGISITNALSEYMVAEVHRDGKIYRQRYERGNVKSGLEVVGATDHTGTTIIFKPDSQIFENTVYDYTTLANRFRELAFLNPNLKIVFRDERDNKGETFQFEGGISSFVEFLNTGKEKLYEPPIFISGKQEDIMIEIAIQHNKSYSENVMSFANLINMREGGSHLVGFRAGLTKTLKSYAITAKLIKEDSSLSGEDLREGLTAVVSVKLSDPQFEGQTKTKLGNAGVRGIVENIVSQELLEWLEGHRDIAEIIINKACEASRAREASRKAKETARRKNALGSGGLPGKLTDCVERDPSKCEIFLVEGESAGGSSRQGRNRQYQAVLPLRGKVLNTERSTIDKLLKNDEIKNIVIALGAGIGNDFDIKKLRYDKIILNSDADVDGSHIKTLLLTLFFRYMRQLIEDGHVYLACPPLYEIKKAKVVKYAYSDEQKDNIIKEMGDKCHITRYKGLGEMNSDKLWETTMNPETRTMVRIKLTDAEEADRVFSMLMGTDVPARRAFIEENATYATLDV